MSSKNNTTKTRHNSCKLLKVMCVWNEMMPWDRFIIWIWLDWIIFVSNDSIYGAANSRKSFDSSIQFFHFSPSFIFCTKSRYFDLPVLRSFYTYRHKGAYLVEFLFDKIFFSNKESRNREFSQILLLFLFCMRTTQ